MIETIIDLAKALGQVQEGDAETLRTLCQAAEQELTLGLKDGVSPEHCAPAFTAAAAFLALSALAQKGGVTRFSAGDLTIEEEPNRPNSLREQGLGMMAPYLRDGDFFFAGVRG